MAFDMIGSYLEHFYFRPEPNKTPSVFVLEVLNIFVSPHLQYGQHTLKFFADLAETVLHLWRNLLIFFSDNQPFILQCF